MLRYILLSFLAFSASAFVLEHNPCKQAGFFALKDNTAAFYGCYPNKAGGFNLKVLTCPAKQVFSAAVGHCVPASPNLKQIASGDESTTPADIEQPTPPKQPSDDNSTTPTPDDTTSECPDETTTTSHPDETTTEKEDSTTERDESTTPPPEDSTTDTDGTTESDQTTEPAETPKPFICPTTGFFPTNGACNKFVYCMSDDGKTDPVELACPKNQQFNPETLFCDSNYKCDGSDIDTKALLEFDCLMEGTFPDSKDHAKYFICSWSENAKSFEYDHKICPQREVFNKLTGRCGRHIQLPKSLLHIDY